MIMYEHGGKEKNSNLFKMIVLKLHNVRIALSRVPLPVIYCPKYKLVLWDTQIIQTRKNENLI